MFTCLNAFPLRKKNLMWDTQKILIKDFIFITQIKALNTQGEMFGL